ncbi:MAG: diacylglycerol/lipid kinase family protein, partial [Wenzhouxiangella sp.]
MPAPTVAAGTRATDPAAACILVNPRSFRISGGNRLNRVCRAARTAGTPVHVVHDPDEIRSALAGWGTAPPQRLVVIGGDGTVQAAASALIDTPPPSIPPLLVLGGGRTNFTARDLGTHRCLASLLEQVLHRPDELNLTRRRILTLEQPAAGCALHGFFVAGALVDHVIRDCHRYRSRHRGWLRTGAPSSAWRVAQLGLLGALGRSRFRP